MHLREWHGGGQGENQGDVILFLGFTSEITVVRTERSCWIKEALRVSNHEPLETCRTREAEVREVSKIAFRLWFQQLDKYQYCFLARGQRAWITFEEEMSSIWSEISVQ